MKNFVLACGYDCDRAFSSEVTKYTSEELATKAAKESNEWSDGVGYSIADEEEAKRFAEHYGINFPNYAFDENSEIVEDVPPPQQESPPLTEEDEPRPDGEKLLDDDAWSGGFADNH